MTTTTKSPIVREEFAGAILGVKGRFFGATIGGKNYKPGTFTSQKFVTESRPFKSYGARALIKAKIRFDDNCRNGHNTFAITGEIYIPGARDCEACGCIHDDLAKAFPELAPLIKWHLTSSDSPMHYIANTVYHASNRDLDAARAAAVWPDATDAELMVSKEELTAALQARQPALVKEFRDAMESTGFLWAPEAE